MIAPRRGFGQAMRSHVLRVLFAVAWTGMVVLMWLYAALLRLANALGSRATRLIRLASRGYLCPMLRREDQPRVAIIGGGFAGAYLAHKLQHHARVTLVDDKDFWEYTPSVPRTIVEPGHVTRIQLRHVDYLDPARSDIVLGRVERVDAGALVLQGTGRVVLFDYAVLASGSTYHMPFKEGSVISATRGCTLQAYAASLARAQRVLVIGGGIVGVEIAGEIAEAHPHVHVTLAHSGATLMSSSTAVPRAAGEYAEGFLAVHGVNVVTSERVNQTEDGSFVGSSGQIYECNLAFLCTGIRPNTHYLRGGSLSGALDERGFVSVNANLQVPDAPNVFAAGDLVALPVEKLAQTAESMAHCVAVNLGRLIQGNAHLHAYRMGIAPMIISLGRYEAIFVVEGYWFRGLIAALMKEFVEHLVVTSYSGVRPNWWL